MVVRHILGSLRLLAEVCEGSDEVGSGGAPVHGDGAGCARAVKSAGTLVDDCRRRRIGSAVSRPGTLDP